VSINKKTKDFWEDCHNKQIVPSLSGCGYEETIKWLQIEDLLKPGMTVLEFGVGMCYVTKGFKLNNFKVSALDISDKALQNAKEYCEAVYSLDTIESLPSDYFDIILCHNTVQHIPTDSLKLELQQCIRSLKPVTGIFAVEFVSAYDIEDTGENPNIESISSGILCRSVNFMQSLIQLYNAKSKIMYSAENLKTNSPITGAHILHIYKE